MSRASRAPTELTPDLDPWLTPAPRGGWRLHWGRRIGSRTTAATSTSCGRGSATPTTPPAAADRRRRRRLCPRFCAGCFWCLNGGLSDWIGLRNGSASRLSINNSIEMMNYWLNWWLLVIIADFNQLKWLIIDWIDYY